MTEFKPTTVFWEVTRACNLECIHCSNKSGNKLEDELRTEEVKLMINDLVGLGMEDLRLYGGEPLVRQDLFDIAQYARNLSLDLALSLYTNGTIISPYILNNLGKLAFKKIYLSIHDCRPEIHDKITKYKGSLARVTDVSHELADFKLGINYTISKLNIDSIRDTFAFAKNELNADTMHVSILTNVGRATEHEELKLNKEDLLYLAETVSQAYIDFFGGQQARPCEAATKRVMIGADGNIYPCPLFIERKFSAGNIRDRSFRNIWENPLTEFKEVRQAILTSSINDGCRSRAYYFTDNLKGQDFYWDYVKELNKPAY